MPLYEIEQYETWTHKVRVRADSQAEAIVRLLHEGGECVDDSSELDSVNYQEGISEVEDPELYDAVKALDSQAITDRGNIEIIGSIRSIEEVDDALLEEEEV